ncbi:histidine kinase [Phycicoccus sp.]|uniref:sensor histidine kinase n=1 Tax=Phycicoccus sp. TaxID=1902410 RepID=UPI002C97F7C3|nr:histidine kinase [Phycicoccus sp.]HMM96289.1 histidine kinase [Phycicoccus sp.]
MPPSDPVADARPVGDARPADLRRVMVLAGWVAAAFVAVATLVGGLPPGGRGVAVALMTVLALALWLGSLSTRVTDERLLLALLVGAGLLGAAVDRLDPSGPAYILPFMAAAGLGMRLPRRTALLAGAVVIAAGTWAEASTSATPASAGLDVAIGGAFLLAAAAFAGANRDAHERARELLRLQEETRMAREEAAVLAERGRIARELHDVLAHTLSGLAVQLEGARLLAAHTGADARLVEQIGNAQGLARSGMSGAKRAVATLRGEALPGTEQVPELVEQARLATGAPVTYTVVGEPVPLAPERGLPVYRAAQEALANVAKHAQGAPTTVTLRWGERAAEVEVVDSGGRPTGLPSGGFGLTGLAERAALAGGRLEAGPADTGWRVHLTMPYTDEGTS